ncbi:MAG: Asp23/Gls24 family envelope stress response protein [Clostridiaceae bacterium]|nr:Asp23/Gls24 family envelope stress response protein [Clostridiaceae bacterium]
MSENKQIESIKGERSMSKGFVAQYAAEAALQTKGVARLMPSAGVAVKESLGVLHEGKGVSVVFHENDDGFVSVTVYPVIYYGMIIPEVAWSIQERVKADVERFTGLVVEAVDVHVCGVVTREENQG